MNNTVTSQQICITPSDESMKLVLNSIRVLSLFKCAGYNKRVLFIEAVQSKESKFLKYTNIKKLENFWSGRTKCEKLNSELEIILNQIING